MAEVILSQAQPMTWRTGDPMVGRSTSFPVVLTVCSAGLGLTMLTISSGVTVPQDFTNPICQSADVAQVDTSAAFEVLVGEWRDGTNTLSSSFTHIVTHPAYQRIIGLGPAAVPLILSELAREPDHWGWALAAITGQNPVPPEAEGNLDAMAAAWLQWGRERKLIS